MTAVDVAARVRTAGLATIERQCLGDEFGFDAVGQVAQTPGGMAVIYTLITSTRSPLLGQPALANVSQIASPSPTVEQVEQVVTEAMRGLRDLSRKMLAEANGNAKAQQN
jgi:hypothetical protein